MDLVMGRSWGRRRRSRRRTQADGTTAAMGGAYEFTKNASANLRQKDDAYNPALGGLMSGAMLGLRCRFT